MVSVVQEVQIEDESANEHAVLFSPSISALNRGSCSIPDAMNRGCPKLVRSTNHGKFNLN